MNDDPNPAARRGASAAPLVRSATAADVPVIHTIYGHHVLHGVSSFEEQPPDLDEMHRRLQGVQERGFPYVVVERDGLVRAFAYAGPFRPRPAYRYTVEDSVYVAPDSIGQGLGRACLGEVIRRCTALGLRQMVAVIGVSGNSASMGLHESLGFREAGRLRSIGFKFGRWVDIVMMQRTLGAGDAAPPHS